MCSYKRIYSSLFIGFKGVTAVPTFNCPAVFCKNWPSSSSVSNKPDPPTSLAGCHG